MLAEIGVAPPDGLESTQLGHWAGPPVARASVRMGAALRSGEFDTSPLTEDIPTDWTETIAAFDPFIDVELPPARSLAQLQTLCDAKRPSNDTFYALRLDGAFAFVRMRPHALALEREWANVSGTLVGLWSPGKPGESGISGYHLQFLSADRRTSGQLIACASSDLRLRLEPLAEFIWYCLRSHSVQP
ncbi:acetolactate decarboxylase [Paraburkholderia silviterrae]|nr:acetolactate decarboxylase [Paraburkholderia silviterrae]